MADLSVADLVVEFIHDGYAVRPLDGVGFEADRGEIVVLLGPSGCGKTTLLSCLGGILTPTSGSIRVDGVEVAELRGRDLERYRRERVGFVFQAFNLIPSLSARENIAMPLILTGHPRRAALRRADALLETVGLSDRAAHKPAKLSGGQQQRVAVARGLAGDPPLLIADEPTANLDHIQAETIVRLLRELRSQGRTIVISTHDDRLVPIADRIVRLVPEPVDDAGVDAERQVTFPAGTSVFEQGDRSDVVYVIDDGEVEIVRVLADGTESVLARLGPGQYFGELGPLLGFPRSASARAVTDLRVTSLGPDQFTQHFTHER